MPNASPKIIKDENRIATLHQLLLLDTGAEEAFDRLTKLASKIIGAPVSLVSLVDANRQYFKSMVGLPEPWASARETPLTHSFCQHVVALGKPLVIEDARKNPLVHDNLAIPDMNVIGYLGIPISTSDGTGLGSFCVIDDKPRKWTDDEIYIMEELARAVMTEIELRAEILYRKTIEDKLLEAQSVLKARNMQMQRVVHLTESTVGYTINAVERGADGQEILVYLQSAQESLAKAIG